MLATMGKMIGVQIAESAYESSADRRSFATRCAVGCRKSTENGVKGRSVSDDESVSQLDGG